MTTVTALPVPRRIALSRAACGFGSLALAGLAGSAGAAVGPHLPPRAKRVIFLFMAGGVSHVDSFDHKPRLFADDGKQMPFGDLRSIAKTGTSPPQRVMKPLWKFARHGHSGQWVSELFPEMAGIVDELCLVKSLHTEGIAHGPATLFLHTGSTTAIRPSMGAWVHYGLGSENADLPGFVSLSPALANGGPRNYGHAFLPAIHQGTAVGRAGQPATEATVPNLAPARTGALAERGRLLASDLARAQLAGRHGDGELEAVIAAQELAARMQAAAPRVFDIADETAETLALYGIGAKETDNFGRQCLLARRLVESGVRFVQVNYTDNSNNPAWDQHSNMPKHLDHARAVDRPVAALVTDLKRRGLLDDTIVWWGGEFGRTPYAQDNGTGRDHNPAGFTVWLAGGGFRAGHAHGATDEFGHHAIADRVHMHDLHATLLAALGLDHERLTSRHAGRDFRLTDVAGRVVTGLFA
ncbi:MAG: DUF1501 domain-containing protein [Planctomycetes bacterium]|nr:DUF1501 domain-containing protein [Planctomycetota bacterium]MBM4056778.1 DUF1501 domain-containing protein [Planctomycetota bacterium]